jgi:hypothetical protein
MPEMKLSYCLFPPNFSLLSTPLKNVEEGTLPDCTGYLPPDNTALHLAVVHTADETAGQQLSCTAGETAVVGGAAADPELPEEARAGGGEEAQFELFDSDDAENAPDMGSGKKIFHSYLGYLARNSP